MLTGDWKKNMNNTVLITGGTGLLGTEITAELLRTGYEKIYVFVRAEDNASALHRLKEAWYPFKELYQAIGTVVKPVTGDLCAEGLGLREEDRDLLCENVEMVIHTAAETGLQKSEQDLMKVNRDGTAKMLALAQGMKKLQKFVYISTAYTAGQRTGIIREDDPLPDVFSSQYERSKSEAEQLAAIHLTGKDVKHHSPGCEVLHLFL